MRYYRRSTSLPALLSIILLYVVLIVLLLFFSHRILTNISLDTPVVQTIILPLSIILPVFLLISLLYNIVKLVRERSNKQPGARFKTRLVLFFVFVSLLASVPQGILSLNFINTTLESWLAADIGDSLRSGLNTALAYYRDRVENLVEFSSSSAVVRALETRTGAPSYTAEYLLTLNPMLDAVEVLDPEGNTISFSGVSDAAFALSSSQRLRNGLYPKETREDITIIRYVRELRIRDRQLFLVTSLVNSRDFDTQAQQMTSSVELFTQLDRYQDVFGVIILLFYSFFSLPLLLLALLVSFLLSEEVIQPVVNLEEATRKIAEGDYSVRILTRSNDELSILTNSFNKMVSELESSRKKVIQSEKISTWQEIAQRLAHEIKNPLTPIKLSAQRLLRKYYHDKDKFEKILEPSVSAIMHEIDNLNSLLAEFRDFARLPQPTKQRFALRELLDELVGIYAHSNPGIVFDFSLVKEEFMVNADKDQMKQVFVNLFQNAIASMGDEGKVIIRANLVKKGESQYSRIQVEDTGSGISEAEQEKIFNPYFTTKRTGTGLGLSIVERIVFDHSGNIWFESQEGRGTVFYIDLPV
ncbi:MAG: ATP-binding protein [Spirochaetia bacterium]